MCFLAERLQPVRVVSRFVLVLCFHFALFSIHRGFAQTNPYAITTLAGSAGSSGSTDGTNNVARFNRPNGIAIDPATNVYVVESRNYAIRKLALAGTNWVVTTIAGSNSFTGFGSADGTNSAARFGAPNAGPMGITADDSGTLYVADTPNHTIRRIVPSGTNWIVTTISGSHGNPGTNNGNSAARFNLPQAIAVDSSTNLFVADTGNHTIRKITPTGTNWAVTTIAGTPGAAGSSDGTNTAASFNSPSSVALDGLGNLYVGDTTNCTIRKITAAGTNWVVSTIAGSAGNPGASDGTNNAATFTSPNGIAVDASGNLFVADQANHTLRQITPVATNWVVSTIAGSAGTSGSSDGISNAAGFNNPAGLVIDSFGNFFVADSRNHTIRGGTRAYPFIQTQPQSQYVGTGSNATFSVSAIGAGPLSYRWQFNGASVAGATLSTLTVSNVTSAQSGNYWVVITNKYNSVTSSVAQLLVFSKQWTGGGDGKSWTNAPNWSGGTVPGPTDIIFIGAGAGTITNVPGALTLNSMLCQRAFAVTSSLTTTGAVDVVSNLYLAPGASLTVSGSNATFIAESGVTSDTANLFALQGGSLNLPGLASYTNSPGSNATIQASGPGSVLNLPALRTIRGPQTSGRVLAIQALQGALVSFPGLTNIVGSTSGGSGAGTQVKADGSNSIIVLANLLSFTDQGGSGTSFLRQTNGGLILLRSNTTYSVTTQLAPLFLSGVQGTYTVSNWLTVAYSVAVSATAPTYRWLSNGVVVSSGTNNSYVLTNVQPAWSGSGFSVIASNAFGSITSAVVTLVVPAEPIYTTVNGGGQVKVSPAATNYYLGQPFTLSATANPYYVFAQWGDGVTNNPRPAVVNSNNLYAAFFTNTMPLEDLVFSQRDQSYGGTNDDYIVSVQPTSDGGYILGGYSSSPPSGNKTSVNFGGDDFWLVKVDANGNKQWEQTYGGTNDDVIASVQQTSDGGYLLAGYSNSGPSGNKSSTKYGNYDYWIVKVDANGNKQWEQSFGGSGDDELAVARQTSDGGFILGGYSASGTSGNKTGSKRGAIDYWLVKVDANGNKQWDQTYGGILNNYLKNLLQAGDGGYVLGGYSGSSPSGNKTSPNYGSYDYWLVKVDASGNVQWDQSYGGSGDDELATVRPASDGGYLLGGYSASGMSGNKSGTNYGNDDYWLAKVDANGNRQWDQSYGGISSDDLADVLQTGDGGLILGGSSSSGISGNKTTPGFGNLDYWVLKLDANNNKVWDYSFGGTSAETLTDLQPTADGGMVLGGDSTSGATGNKTAAKYGGHDGWVLKLGERVAPVGAPVILINGQYSPSNTLAVPVAATNVVTLQTTYPSGNLFFTLDGTVPDVSSGNYYTNPFTITPPVVIRARAYSQDLSQQQDTDPVTISILPVYTLTDTTPGGGSVSFSPPGGVYFSNTVVTATATTSNGWTFMGWQGASSSTNNPVTVTVNSATNLGAVFGTTIAVTTNVTGAAVALWPSPGPYPFGSTVRFQGVPPAGYYFSRWFNAVVGPTNNPLAFLVTSNNPFVNAFFNSIPAGTPTNFTLTTLLNGFGTVTRSPSASYYASNSTVQLTAVPDTGYAFAGWTGDAAGAVNPLSLVVNSNEVITASFTNAPINLVPFVGISSPTNGASFIAPASININATASDSDGTVVQVVLMNGANPLATLTNSPYSFVWTNASVGTAVLTAVVTDNGGLSVTSSPVSITIQTALPQIAIDNPTNGAAFITPASILVSATASDADNSIARVELYSQISTNNSQPVLLTSITNPPYSFTWSGMATGAYALTARAIDSYGPIVTSAPVSITVSAPPGTNQPVFLFSQTNYSVHESNGFVTVTVLNNGDLGGLVNYTTIDGTAHGGSGYSGDYITAQGSFQFAPGQHSTNLSITIRDNFLNRADIQFQVQLFQPSAGTLGNPSAATVTIHQDDGPSNSLPVISIGSPQPASTGRLLVTLTPPGAGGQWRFPWDLGWRNSGDTATNLEAGDYQVLLRSTSNYLAFPSTATITVTNNGTTPLNIEYLPTLPPSGPTDTGSLTVNIGPNAPPNSGWRLFGEGPFRAPNSSLTGLLPDTYFIEFSSVSNWVRPAGRAVQVFGGQATTIPANYLSAPPPPTNGPAPVISAQFNDPVNYPFWFNGQLQTDVGYGSGVAVRETVVLTAAHMVFNDTLLSYVNSAWWSYQQETGTFQPRPMAARGWYILSGYSAQRALDVTNAAYGPDVSSPQSRELDLAALYFLTPSARGGYGGYLSSDLVPNPFLTGVSLKFVAGYPVDGSAFGQVLQPGLLYSTPSVSSAFTQNSNDVYTANWFITYPGNSGGPVYVQFNNYYYPAGVYLGTILSGGNYYSAVRAINSDVVNLINLASSLGDAGTNNTGGGVITFIPVPGLNASNAAAVQVVLGPAAAVQAGAGWRLHGDTIYGTAAKYTREVTTNGASIEFKPLPGWNPPANRAVQLTANALTVISNVSYSAVPPIMFLDPGVGLGMTGTTNTSYRLERATNLLAGPWLPVRTNTLTNGFSLLLPWPPVDGASSFYRTVWLP